MPFLSEYYKIKKRIVNILINDEEFVKLVTNKDVEGLPAYYLIDQLLDDGSQHPGQIHLYDYVPGESATALSHVCIEVAENETDNVFTGKFLVQIDIFVPEQLMNMYGNIRRDAIAARIDALLNGKHLVLAQVKRVNGGLAKPIAHWRERSLCYEITGWNRSYESQSFDSIT